MAKVNDAKRNKRVSSRAAYVSAWFVAVLIAPVFFLLLFCSSLAGDSVQCSTINKTNKYCLILAFMWRYGVRVCVCAMPTKVHCNLQLCIQPDYAQQCTSVAMLRPEWPLSALHRM